MKDYTKSAKVVDHLRPPHGGRPPSDEAVAKATARYVEQEKLGLLKDLPRVGITYQR